MFEKDRFDLGGKKHGRKESYGKGRAKSYSCQEDSCKEGSRSEKRRTYDRFSRTDKATVAKKAAAKKPAAKKPAVVKKGVQEYKDVINWKKWEAHNMNWLYIEVNAGDLMTELEAGVNNIKTVTEAMLDSMLEGDTFIVESEKASTKLTVRYYCDNLSEERRKYSEVNG